MKNKLGILPNLTKAYILERISQEEIMEYYTKVPVNNDTLAGNSFTSPMRRDKNPTCNYYYGESREGPRLRLRDWNGSFKGDVFDVASHFTRIKINTSQGFNLLLHQVARDFKIHIYRDAEERRRLDFQVKEYKRSSSIKIFKVIPRGWNEYDRRYWEDKYGITVPLLKFGKVYGVSELYLQNEEGDFKQLYSYRKDDPCYAYHGGKKKGINVWKFYFPLRKDGRRKFLSNYAFIYNADRVLPSKIGIITKSAKDVLVYKKFGIEAIAVPSETYLMTKDEFFDFKSKFDIVFTNFDYDGAGIRLANKYKKVHRCTPLMLTRGRFGMPDYAVKDLSDFRETFGDSKTLQLIQSVLRVYNNYLTELSNETYNKLKWIQ